MAFKVKKILIFQIKTNIAPKQQKI